MSELKAIRAKRVYAIDRDLLIAGPNLPQAVEKLRVILASQGRPERK
jgi:ABC-type hemin transport system substrate-binding protein